MKNRNSAALLRVVCCGLILGLLPGLVMAGGSKEPAKTAGGGKAAELLMMTIGNTEEMVFFNTLVDNFNKKNEGKIHVTLEEVPGSWDDLGQKILSLMVAGTPPDIIRYLGPGMPNYAEQKVVYDLSDWLKRDISMADYYESAFESIKIGGRTYGVPTGIYTLNVYYNKKVFDKAGLPYPRADYNNPWTLEEFYDTARKLTSGSGPNKVYGFYANMDYGRITPLFFANGGDTFSPDRKSAALDSKAVIDAYTMAQTLIKEGVSPSPSSLQTMPVDQLFMSDRLGLLIEGEWMMPPFTANKDLSFGVAPVPKGSAGSVTLNYIDQWCITAKSKHPAEAWEMLKYLIGDEAEEFLVKNNVFGIPVNRKVAQKMKDQMFNPLSPAEKQVFFDSVDHSKGLYWHPKLGELGTAFYKTTDLIALQQVPAADGMRQINKDWNDILNSK